MPENDQTRWVGIRPVNPAEDIPVTLDAEVVHVIVDAGGGGGLMPGAPLLVQYYNALSVKDTWYTILNIAGIGHIMKIHYGLDYNFSLAECRVTVDGGVPVTYTATANTILVWKSLTRASDYYKELPVFLIRYTTSVKVEIRQTYGANRKLYGLCSYLPDP